MIVASVQESIEQGRVVDETGPRASRNGLQTVTLLDAIAAHRFDAAFGGARRDEERARARSGSCRSVMSSGMGAGGAAAGVVGSLQRPHQAGGACACVSDLNWTELDVWQYIAEEGLEVPSIYFAHEREVFARDGMLYATSPHVRLGPGEEPFLASVRYRTVGDMTCTGAVESTAATLRTSCWRSPRRRSPSVGRRARMIG